MLKKRRIRIVLLVTAAVVALLVAAFAIALSLAAPQITLSCTEETVEVFSNYTRAELSANAKILWFNINLNISSSGEVDSNKLG